MKRRSSSVCIDFSRILNFIRTLTTYGRERKRRTVHGHAHTRLQVKQQQPIFCAHSNQFEGIAPDSYIYTDTSNINISSLTEGDEKKSILQENPFRKKSNRKKKTAQSHIDKKNNTDKVKESSKR